MSKISFTNLYIKGISSSQKEKKKSKERKKCFWTKEENEQLIKCVNKFGKNWKECAKYIKGKKGKQCRDHWINCLDPKLNKKDFSKEEDILIISLFNKYKSWVKIKSIFKNRSENKLKNRYNNILKSYAKSQMTKEEKKISRKLNQKN